MVVQRFDGDQQLSRRAPLYVEQIGPELAAVGIVVDGDDKGPAQRTQQFQRAFTRWSPPQLVAGAVVGDRPRWGLWVSPDNSSPGNFDNLLEKAAEGGRSQLLANARGLVDAESSFEALNGGDRRKAMLGIVGQVDSPAGALFDSARAWQGWVAGAPHGGPFAPLCTFLEHLAR